MKVVVTPSAQSGSGRPSELLPTRQTLLERLRDLGNHDSWQEFFDLYRKLIYSTAIRAGLTEPEAEEVVQETMVGVAQRMATFQYDPEKCSFKGWLMHLTRRRVIDCLRRRRVQLQMFEPLGLDTEETEIVDGAAWQAFEALWTEEWKAKLLSAADERVRKQADPWHYVIYDLHCLRKMTVREVSKLLEISRLRVRVITHRVARKVQREVRRLQNERM